MKQMYLSRNFNKESKALIAVIDRICGDYMAQGFVLTVRQLYYQLVARNIIPNNERSYKNTTSLVNDARLAGLIDWSAIEDRTRSFEDRAHWDDAATFMDEVTPQFYVDMWAKQDERVFVIVEKEALAGVLQKVCHENDVPLLAARGYPSVSVLREFAIQRIIPRAREGQRIHILHLGDHDPSGIDMTRDLEDRLNMLTFHRNTFTLERIALTMDQIEENDCPPNPAKLSDARSTGYVEKFGESSWELDALEPKQLVLLVEDKIGEHRDPDLWDTTDTYVEETRTKLIAIADKFREDEVN